MHTEIFNKFHELSDDEWIDLIFQSIDTPVIDGCQFPGFPDENIQARTIGSSGRHSLYEPKQMYKEIKRITIQQYKPINEQTTLLDFACGYGRMVRFFMKDVFPGNLYASDVLSEYINICRNTFFALEACDTIYNDEVIFDINNPFPPLRYEEESFDIIMVYSLFSHLSESAHLAWLEEFFRILKPDGLLFLTFNQKAFLTRLKNISHKNEVLTAYDKSMVNLFCDISIQKRFVKGEYIYKPFPIGNGSGLTGDFYGDTVIPNKYIHHKWVKWFDIVDHYDDPSRLPQALICLKKRKKLHILKRLFKYSY
jgi:ubiquinone/menaquinone biosynthesis C-methylase UbiE